MLNKIQSKTINDSIEKERVMDTKEANTITDLNQFKASESKTVNRNNNGEGIMSVVNAKTGKRITLSRQLMDKLNSQFFRCIPAVADMFPAEIARIFLSEQFVQMIACIVQFGTAGN